MKQILNKLTLSSIIATSLLFNSCSTDDKTIEIVDENVTTGAILRTLEVNSSFFNRDNEDSFWEITFEEQDEELGGLLSKVDVYASFIDEPNGTNSVSDRLIATIPASEFGVSEDGLPMASVKAVLKDVNQALGLNPGDYQGEDIYQMRLELTLTDGRVFTNTDVSGAVSGGSFFRSPFLYNVPIICIPQTPFSGTYEMDFTDSFGDGWNGASLRVEIDGNSTSYTLASGSSASFSFDVPANAQSLNFYWTQGSFDEEIGLEITAPSGNVVYTGVPANSGQFFLNLCDE